MAAQCRDICLRNPDGYEYDSERQVIVFDVKLTVDAVAVVKRFDEVARAIQQVAGVLETRFVEIPPVAAQTLALNRGLRDA